MDGTVAPTLLVRRVVGYCWCKKNRFELFVESYMVRRVFQVGREGGANSTERRFTTVTATVANKYIVWGGSDILCARLRKLYVN